MLCINNTSSEAYFNLASEEYLLKNLSEDIFMLWQNEPSVVVGKHQNVWAEVNVDFAREHQIKIVRRYTGGGTVYHDMGNVNLTFIEKNSNPDFDVFTNKIIDFLSTIGIEAKADARRGLNIDGLKISGSAQCIHRGKIMHHATLLFSSDLARLTTILDSKYIEPIDSDTPRRVYVKSVKSPVTNISEQLKVRMGLSDFKQAIMDYFFNSSTVNSIYNFSNNDIEAINILKQEKYATQNWNMESIYTK